MKYSEEELSDTIPWFERITSWKSVTPLEQAEAENQSKKIRHILENHTFLEGRIRDLEKQIEESHRISNFKTVEDNLLWCAVEELLINNKMMQIRIDNSFGHFISVSFYIEKGA